MLSLTTRHRPGVFVVSLDFELMWGVRDVKSKADYRENIIGVRQAIPAMLSMFSLYEITATFATVGLLFAKDRSELQTVLPARIPNYLNRRLSPYNDYIKSIGLNEKEDPYHFGLSLIDLIDQADQEIACHTFSHYYNLEEGQDTEDFRADLLAALHIASARGFKMRSIIFPRNQYNEACLAVCKEEGFICFRGTEQSWLYRSSSSAKETFFRRILRLGDAYVNLSGYHCFDIRRMNERGIVNLPSSRFLRPYSHRLSFLEAYRMRRIKDGMTHAAKNGLGYHLWWHPHNFGVNLKHNIDFLESILIHYKKLSREYDFRNLSMRKLADEMSSKS